MSQQAGGRFILNAPTASTFSRGWGGRRSGDPLRLPDTERSGRVPLGNTPPDKRGDLSLVPLSAKRKSGDLASMPVHDQRIGKAKCAEAVSKIRAWCQSHPQVAELLAPKAID